MSGQFFYVPVELCMLDSVLQWDFFPEKKISLNSKNLQSSFEEGELLFAENKSENFKFNQEIFFSYLCRNNEKPLADIVQSLESNNPQVIDIIKPLLITVKAEQTICSLILEYPSTMAVIYVQDDILYIYTNKIFV